MKTITPFLAFLCLSLYGTSLFGQATDPGNTPSSINSFLGRDATTTQDLNIKHEGPYPIIFSTDQSERMRCPIIFIGHPFTKASFSSSILWSSCAFFSSKSSFPEISVAEAEVKLNFGFGAGRSCRDFTAVGEVKLDDI